MPLMIKLNRNIMKVYLCLDNGHFITVDVYARKKILGHKLKDITFDIYTNASKNKLWTEVNKIII